MRDSFELSMSSFRLMNIAFRRYGSSTSWPNMPYMQIA